MSKKEKDLEHIEEMKRIIAGKDPNSRFYPVFLHLLGKLNKLEVELLGEEE
tara:strand:+ start:7128 stop:7280 length:153 start_codon:yes stop_codon:yes gene_type:complete